MRLGCVLRFAVCLSLLPLTGCTLFDTTCEEEDRDCLGKGIFAEGLGGSCSRTADCKDGLYCDDGACSARGDTERGEACRLTAECGDDDFCAGSRVCAVAGFAQEMESCVDTSDCEHGLICEAPDLSELGQVTLQQLAQSAASCKDGGALEQGELCEVASDCVAGLYCASLDDSDPRCISPPVPLEEEPPALPVANWDGVECASFDSDDPPQALFEVPGVEEDAGEFYRLPFPNDIRLRDGRVDISDHPTPPSGVGLPVVRRYIDAVESDANGFSTSALAMFRFSHPYEFGSVNGDSVRIVDITPDSPTYDADASIEWKQTEGPLSNYACPHWLAFRRPPGEPLRSGTTYAAIVTTDVVPDDGDDFERGRDFEAMLDDDEPSGSDLRRAHAAYAPLREWIEDTDQDPDSILNAAVFTTMDAEELMPRLREQIVDDGVASVDSLVHCDSADTVSPCETTEMEDGEEVTRGACRAASDNFAELHGRIELPVFQTGTLPYLEPDEGGGFEFDDDGVPQVQDHREVCIAISVPSDEAPESGYPVIVYAHGTGGTFNGQMGSSGFAEVAATADVPAVLVGIDLPMHGDRRGDSSEDPDSLFFNVLNPAAARYNVAQGSADLMGVVQWVKQGGLAEADSPTGEAVSFDSSRILLFGHSQGATHSALLTSYEPDVLATVLSGVGGHLASSLLTKKSPVDISSVLPLALLDPDDNFDLAGGGLNPALALVQWAFDPVDPINYAHRLYREPTEQVPSGQHIFMTYGVGDTYSTEVTQEAYARAGRFHHVAPVLVDLGLPEREPPVSGNRVVDDVERTIAMRQYRPVDDGDDEVDGHFVAVRAGQEGRGDVVRFLEQALAGEVPEIGQ